MFNYVGMILMKPRPLTTQQQNIHLYLIDLLLLHQNVPNNYITL
jgi:hypothetical protein